MNLSFVVIATNMEVDLSLHFTSDQLKGMSSYERTRNENLIRDHEFKKVIGKAMYDNEFVLSDWLSPKQ